MSENSKKIWQDRDYKDYMVKKFLEFYNSNPDYRERNNKILDAEQKRYWANPEHRKKASEKVRQFFEQNPEAKQYLSELAKEQWKNFSLVEWRSNKTKSQWTSEFRLKRKKAYDQTYYSNTISFMKKIL